MYYCIIPCVCSKLVNSAEVLQLVRLQGCCSCFVFRWSPGSRRVVDLQFRRVLGLRVFNGLNGLDAKTMETWWVSIYETYMKHDQQRAKGPGTSRNYEVSTKKTEAQTETWSTKSDKMFKDVQRNTHWNTYVERQTQSDTDHKRSLINPMEATTPFSPNISRPFRPLQNAQNQHAMTMPWHSGPSWRRQIRQLWQLSAVQPFCSSTWTLAMLKNA